MTYSERFEQALKTVLRSRRSSNQLNAIASDVPLSKRDQHLEHVEATIQLAFTDGAEFGRREVARNLPGVDKHYAQLSEPQESAAAAEPDAGAARMRSLQTFKQEVRDLTCRLRSALGFRTGVPEAPEHPEGKHLTYKGSTICHFCAKDTEAPDTGERCAEATAHKISLLNLPPGSMRLIDKLAAVVEFVEHLRDEYDLGEYLADYRDFAAKGEAARAAALGDAPQITPQVYDRHVRPHQRSARAFESVNELRPDSAKVEGDRPEDLTESEALFEPDNFTQEEPPYVLACAGCKVEHGLTESELCFGRLHRGSTVKCQLCHCRVPVDESELCQMPPSFKPTYKVHYLKTVQPYFGEVESGRKTFEIRENDRNYQTGDHVVLQEYELPTRAGTGGLTGRELRRRITYITAFLQTPGYVVFGMEPIEEVQP